MEIQRFSSCHRLRFIFAVLVVYHFWGCFSTTRLSERPADDFLFQLSKTLQHRAHSITTAVYRAKFSIALNTGNFGSIVYLYLKKPDSLLIEIPGFFGIGSFRALVINREQMLAYFPHENLFYRGSVVSFPAEELWPWKVLSGPAWEALFAEENYHNLEFERYQKGVYFFTCYQNEWQGIIAFDRKAAVRRSFWRSVVDSSIWVVNYKSKTAQLRGSLLEKIEFKTKAGEHFLVRFDEQYYNSDISAGKFRIEIPEDAREILPDNELYR